MSIIHKETTDFGKLEQLLKKEGFSSQDEYCMVRFLPLIQSPDSGQNETTLRALGTNLEAICPGSLYIICDTELGLFVDLSCFRKASTRSFHSALADIIRDSLQRAGISRYFSAVTDICAAWKQAKIALTYGYRIHPTYWYFRFDDYALEYLLNEGLQDFNPEQVCSPVILQLRNYDQKKGTELGKTLATYLENALNASITAKKLYISRSTFLKRMKRIEMLTHLNLDNQVKRFYLELSFFLLKSY